MFDWDATNGTDVVSHRFWIYWVVTIPLVLVTFLVWTVWIRYRREEKTAQNGRSEVHFHLYNLLVHREPRARSSKLVDKYEDREIHPKY